MPGTQRWTRDQYLDLQKPSLIPEINRQLLKWEYPNWGIWEQEVKTPPLKQQKVTPEMILKEKQECLPWGQKSMERLDPC